MYKNIEKQTMLNLKDLVEYQEGQVVSKTLVQNDYVSMTIFSFDKGEEISTHAAGGDKSSKDQCKKLTPIVSNGSLCYRTLPISQALAPYQKQVAVRSLSLSLAHSL